MRFIGFPALLTSATALASLSFAAPLANGKDRRSFIERDGVNYTVFEHAATGAKLEFVTNSGICETTPGVNQYSGYLSVGTGMNMWFWYYQRNPKCRMILNIVRFFEARNNPTTAPLATWFNGGPGCSSMIGLFQENGPCHFVGGASTPSLNPYSFNEYANTLYVDQPIGVGFSYGTDSVTSTATAAPYVWKLLQAFYTQFPQYENRDFGIFTESYGGHYGPEFAHYIQQQNSAIDANTTTGQKINLVALGINNGWIDGVIQEKAYVQFSYNNTYKPLISQSNYDTYMATYSRACLPASQACMSTGTDDDCSNANRRCYNDIEGPLTGAANFNVYDIRQPSNDPNPPETYVQYLQSAAVVKAIGAKSTYQECPDAPYNKFTPSGDGARSFLSTLGAVVSTGLTTLIWAGDAE
ncbi:alpha/beta-hydrolase [Glonium stellatum]|uniref:Carboxypeptidase n=1 Tax=Glonium stellatum TaxID=574774 RepID=A0A8E2JRK7_9PEZI|nr:alpha/beta-hydrolase [Glonium stellatum]